MNRVNLTIIERKVLGALLILANEDYIVNASMRNVADKMGYKNPGGSITASLRILEMQNYVKNMGKGQWQILL